MYDYQLYPVAFIENKLIDLEGRSRQNNLRKDGIKGRPNETWEDYEKERDKLFKEILAIGEELVITKKILKNVKKLRGKNIFIKMYFCQATLDHREELRKEVKRLRE